MRPPCLAMVGAGLFGGMLLATLDLAAHKPITSRFTYAADVLPILSARCGSCHRPDGVAPMSLLSYKEAVPWAQAIKEEIVSLRMPPLHAEAEFGRFRNGRALTAREIDILVEWASGGSPEGDGATVPHPAAPVEGWRLGDPDLVVTMAEPFTLDESTREVVRDFPLDAALEGSRWIRAIDFRPGASRIVRSATVFLDPPGLSRVRPPDDVAPGHPPQPPGLPPTDILAIWLPGAPPVDLSRGGYRIPSEARLVLRVHYKKSWMLEGQSLSDRSEVALYFTDPSEGGAVETMIVESEARPAESLSFAHTLTRDVDVLGILPEIDGSESTVRVEAVHPDGRREPLLLLNQPDPSWPTRYWFDRPVALSKGARVEVAATFDPPTEAAPPPSAVRLRLDVVSPAARAAAAGGVGSPGR